MFWLNSKFQYLDTAQQQFTGLFIQVKHYLLKLECDNDNDNDNENNFIKHKDSL